MSLMKLAPEAVRLRRAARAHARGEFSQADYRRARREVIENFETLPGSDDDTRPRPARSRVAPDPPAARGSRWRWLRWLIAALALVLATQLLAQETEFAIPAVAERDPNPATSPRLPVGSVRVQTPDAVPVEVQSVADARLMEIRQRNQAGSHGFTDPELQEIGRLLNALGGHAPDFALTTEDAADLTALLQSQKERRGVSVVELEEVAAAVQQALREAGYFLAVAYLPSQEVAAGGTVEIAVLPGVIERVDVGDADGRLARRFDDLLGRPVTRGEISTRLYALNQAPGLAAQASFEPGQSVGATQLNLKVLERSGLRAGVGMDNFGDDETGRRRLTVDAELVNPSGRGDLLSASLLTALDPDEQLLGSLSYATPVGSRRQLRGRLARNEFETGGPGSIDGTGWLLDGWLDTFLYRDRQSGLSYAFGAGLHELEWQLPDAQVDQSVLLVSSALRWRRVWDASRVALDLEIYGDLGTVDGDTFAGQDDQFWDAGFRLFGWHPLDIGWLPGRQKLALDVAGQLAGTQLPSTRRLALGGVNGARGYQRDLFLADRGLIVRSGVTTPLPHGELTLFVDAAYGRDRNELTPAWAHLVNLGIAWDLALGRHLTSSLGLAEPVTTKGSGGLDDTGTQLYWSLRLGY